MGYKEKFDALETYEQEALKKTIGIDN